MAVDGIANLVQNVADQLFGQKQERHTGTKILGTGREVDEARTEDTFTPSTGAKSTQATAQDAGIFQVSQLALTEVTANLLFERTASNANPNGAPAQATPAATSNVELLQTGGSLNASTRVNTEQLFAANPAAQGTTGVAAATTHVQDQLQALNAALPALGLTNAEIQQIDRIASLIHNFNPAAFTNLVNQFEALAQQASRQNAAIAGANAGAIASANANGGGFQVKEIFIHFVGAQVTENSAVPSGGGQGSGANNIPTTAAGLQIEQVQFTLANGNGQIAQVPAPQQNISAGTTDRQASQTNVAAA